MSTIKFKLISVFSIIYIAVCIIILIASYFFMHSSMVNTMASVYTNSLSLVEQRLLTIQSSASTIANVFYENESVKNALLTDSLNRSIALESRAYISSLELANSSLIEDLNIPFYITIVGDNGFTYTSLRGKDFYDYEQITNSKWFKQLKFKSTEDICFFTNITDSDFLGYSSSNFVAAKNFVCDQLMVFVF